jgi:hypothetical protein
LEANPALTLSLVGNNLFDVDARRSTSILKDFAPLAGLPDWVAGACAEGSAEAAGAGSGAEAAAVLPEAGDCFWASAGLATVRARRLTPISCSFIRCRLP